MQDDSKDPLEELAAINRSRALQPRHRCAPARWNKRYIICPNSNCGYTGDAKRQGKGSFLAFIVLSLLMLLPGLIYLVLYGGYELICPRCGTKIRDCW